MARKGEPRVFSSSDEEAGIAAPADAAMRRAIDQERLMTVPKSSTKQ
jgi:hypothetical protein